MVLYAEVPGFYAEVERSAEPALRERPVVVGGDPRKRGSVQAATPDALAAGVEVGMPVIEALQRCPHARALRTNMQRYREAARQLQAILRRHVERLEGEGLAGAYLEGALDGRSEALGARLVRDVAQGPGWPLRVGVAPARFLAKLAAQSVGAGEVRRIGAEEVAPFLERLPVERLPGVGPKTVLKLAELGVRTAGEAVSLGRDPLERALGNHGIAILRYAQGLDSAPIRATAQRRSLSQEGSFAEPELDVGEIRGRLVGLAQALGAALARENLAARRVVLKMRFEDQQATTRTQSLKRAISDPDELVEVADALLARSQAGRRPLRRVGLALGSLVQARPADDRQLPLFE
jgi:DNA polymerase-4